MMRDKFIEVCVYADSTNLFTEEDCNTDNLVALKFPERIVKDWYEKHESEFVECTANELKKPKSECTFEDWFNEVYTADDTDGLFNFSIEHGYVPEINWGQTEYDPECETENFYPQWDPEEKGYIATCKGCGRKIFLCDACMHSEDNEAMRCDWHRNETGHGCFRGWIKNGE